MHTPGPWTLGDDPCVIESEHADNDLGFVAMVLPSPELSWDMTGEREANARLIAAAPELLAALQSIMSGQLCGNVDTDAQRFQAARAAIAKATGADT